MPLDKRVFKTKTFASWAKKRLTDEALCAAASEIAHGQFEADLGAGVCKKRIALPGMGKSGGARTLVAHQHPAGIIYLVGREKSDKGEDFAAEVVEGAKTIAGSLRRQDLAGLEKLVAGGMLKEICNGKQ